MELVLIDYVPKKSLFNLIKKKDWGGKNSTSTINNLKGDHKIITISEKNLKEEKKLTLTFDEIIQNIDQLKTIGALTVFLNNKLKKNEKKWYIYKYNFKF